MDLKSMNFNYNFIINSQTIDEILNLYVHISYTK